MNFFEKGYKMTKSANTKHDCKDEHRNFKKYEKILLIVFVIILIVSLYKIIVWVKQNKEEKKLTDSLIDEVVSINSNETDNTEEIRIDFDKLNEINNQTVAWIKIPEINLNTPIVQTDNNEHYLYYNFNQQKNKCGCLFMDYRNQKDFTSNNTTIYGHNLYTGMMFGDLKQIFNGDHGNDLKIYIYTKDENYEYKIFSTYKEKPNLNIISQDVNMNYLLDLKNKSKIDFGDVPSDVNNIITLVTCDGTGAGRLVVHGYR